MVTATEPWFNRSGGYNNVAETGVFTYDRAHGSVYNNVSFRQVYDYK